MILKCCAFSALLDRIRMNDKRIVAFGAGTIGQISTPAVLKEYDLLGYLDCYLDNDVRMWGTHIDVGEKKVEIKSPEYLRECSDDTVILLNISRFSDVINQLEGMKCTEKMDCYIMPMMLIHSFCMKDSEGVPILLDKPLIPNKLHYMRLGKKPLSDNLKRCMDSWKKFCPDYEIIEWNENNYDVEKQPYMKAAYESGAYGFVPDYARLDILYNEGGFYLDTDVEIKRNIDGLRYQEAFCGVEKWQVINFGGLSGAIKGHPMIKELIDSRQEISFYNRDGSLNKNTCGFYDTRVVMDKGYRINGKTQFINGMNIYAYDFFQPYDYMSGMINETKNTYSIHWFNGGWLDDEMKKRNEESKQMYTHLYQKALRN